MWDAIWYCIRCMMLVVCASHGHVDPELTWGTGIVGIITLFVVGLLGSILFAILGSIPIKRKKE